MRTRITLAAAVAVALGGSGLYVATAGAAEVVVPGRVQAEAYAAQPGTPEGAGDSGSASGFKLSSGTASSMYGDAFSAWNDKALGSRVENCITQRAKCDSFGTF